LFLKADSFQFIEPSDYKDLINKTISSTD